MLTMRVSNLIGEKKNRKTYLGLGLGDYEHSRINIYDPYRLVH